MQRSIQLPIQHACVQSTVSLPSLFPSALLSHNKLKLKQLAVAAFPPDVTQLLTFSSQAPANEVSHDEPATPGDFFFLSAWLAACARGSILELIK